MGKTTAQNGAYVNVLKNGMISMLLLLGMPPKLIFGCAVPICVCNIFAFKSFMSCNVSNIVVLDVYIYTWIRSVWGSNYFELLYIVGVISWCFPWLWLLSLVLLVFAVLLRLVLMLTWFMRLLCDVLVIFVHVFTFVVISLVVFRCVQCGGHGEGNQKNKERGIEKLRSGKAKKQRN